MNKFVLCSTLLLGTVQIGSAQENTTSASVPGAGESSAAPAPLQLRYNLRPDARYSTQLDVDIKTVTVFGKEKTEMQQDMAFVFDTRILSVDEKGIDMRVHFKNLRMKLKSKDLTVAYDSSKPLNLKKNPSTPQEQAQLFIGRMMGALVGQSIEYRVSPDGKTIGIKGQAAVLQRMLGRAQLPKGADTAQFRKSMQDLIKNVVGGGDKPNQMTGFFTKKPVEIGESWNHSQVSGGQMMSLQNEATYTLKSRENGIATLAVTGYMFDAPKAASRVNSLFSNTTISGTQGGRMQIDENTGWPVSSEIEFRTVTDMDIHTDKTYHVKSYSKGSTRLKSTGG